MGGGDGVINNEFLASLERGDLEAILPWLRLVRLAKGQVLFEPGDPVDYVYFPQSGLISLVTCMSDGHDVENTSRGRDGTIAALEATGSGVMVSKVVAQIAGSAWRLNASRFRQLYEESETARRLLHRRIEFLLAEARQSIACQATHDASARLARVLLACVAHTGEMRLPLTQEFMADMVGVGRTTVTHAASRLKQAGLIRYTRGTVTVVDPGRLEAHACECHALLVRMRAAMLAAPRSALFTGSAGETRV